MDLIHQLKCCNIIKVGNFTLKSGLKSNLYFDFKGLISYPKLISQISYELSKMITKNYVICGVPLGGIPYAVSVSQILNYPMILLRDEKKDYGMCQQIEGNVFNKEVVLIEDVITTGGSVLGAIDILEKNGISVKQIVCILNRDAGGVELLLSKGYDVKWLFKMCDIVDHKTIMNELVIKNDVGNKLMNVIKNKKTNLVLSLDVCDVSRFVDILNSVCDYVCAVKVHCDIFSDDKIRSVLYEFKKKDLLIIEDRKFADIGSICTKQLDVIKEHADIVTVHGICGYPMIKELDKYGVGLLLIHMMSVEDCLIDTIYECKVVDMGMKCKNIIGFVSQKKVDGFLTFSPGVKLKDGVDNMGQKYKSIDKCNADIFIVGRGIYECDDIVGTTITYRDACYKKFVY